MRISDWSSDVCSSDLVAITLRIVLIENLRRLADQITAGRRARADTNALANRLLVSGCARPALETDLSARPSGPLSELFAAQLENARKSAVEGKSVTVRVDLGGRRYNQNKR